jgi:hypothetical protein
MWLYRCGWACLFGGGDDSDEPPPPLLSSNVTPSFVWGERQVKTNEDSSTDVPHLLFRVSRLLCICMKPNQILFYFPLVP